MDAKDDLGRQLADAMERVAALEGELARSQRAQAVLEGQRDFVTRLLDTVRVIIVILDRDARIVGCNSFMEEISGYRLDEVRGRDWFETFLPRRDHERVHQLFDKAVDGNHTRGNVNPILTKGGGERDIEWHDTTLETSEGGVEAVMALGIDVTERADLERERVDLHAQLEDTLAKVISGFLPICSGCKNIRDDEGAWIPVESYVRERTGAQFSHGLCAPCSERLYPDLGSEG
jgi:PAS domain S-box-containing protein